MTIAETQSVCHVCKRTVPAWIVFRGKEVFLEKSCLEHGVSKAAIWPDVNHYRWMESFKSLHAAPSSPHPAVFGCPRDCGPCTNHRRRPVLVEVEVTGKCNLRCPVCFTASGQARDEASLAKEPSMAELELIFRNIMDKCGPHTGIQLTGGEPSFREDLTEIVRLARKIGFDAVELNTNGITLAQKPGYARALADAGISGVFLQFDGVSDDIYRITRGADLLEIKLDAIEQCRRADVQAVLAMTVIDGVNGDQLGEVLRFALKNRDVIAGIAYQPAFGSGRFDVKMRKRLSMGDVIFLLAEQSEGLIGARDLWPLSCSHPLCSCSTYLIEDAKGRIIPFSRQITPEEYLSRADPNSPQGAVLPDIAHRRDPRLVRGLSIVIMNYMDIWNIDLNKLRECSMTVAGRDGKIIPFCAYHLFGCKGVGDESERCGGS